MSDNIVKPTKNWGGVPPTPPPDPPKSRCRGSLVDVNTKIEIGGIVHSANIVHPCALEESNHEFCRCEPACGRTWKKNFKGIRPE